MLITFSGLDGAGKSTLIGLLRDSLESEGRRTLVLTMYDHVGVYALIRAVRDRLRPSKGSPQPTDSDRVGAPRGRSSPLVELIRRPSVKRLVYFLDLAVLIVMRLVLEGCLGRVLILDRYFYDSLADVTDGRRWLFVNAFLKLVPQPDVAVFVDVPPEVAFQRKQEYPLEYLRTRREKYVTIFGRLESPLILVNDDARAAAERVHAAVAGCLEERQARLLRFLLPGQGAQEPVDQALLPAARAEVVTVRAAERLKELGRLPERWRDAAASEQARIAKAVALIGKLSDVLERRGAAFVFTKAFQHWPDMGHDVDLLLLESSPDVDAALGAELDMQPGPDSFIQRVAGKRTYRVPEFGAELEIHHGRLGHLGEHRQLAELVCERRRRVDVGGIQAWVPSDEDALLLQAVQRVCGHRSVRVSDLLRTAALVRGPSLDWPYIARAAQVTGLEEALRQYLSAAKAALDLADLPLAERGCGLRNGAFKHGAVARAYAAKLAGDVSRAQWRSALRVLLLPAAAAGVLAKRALRRAVSYNSGVNKGGVA